VRKPLKKFSDFGIVFPSEKLSEAERRQVIDLVREHGVTKASRVLGIGISTTRRACGAWSAEGITHSTAHSIRHVLISMGMKK